MIFVVVLKYNQISRDGSKLEAGGRNEAYPTAYPNTATT